MSLVVIMVLVVLVAVSFVALIVASDVDVYSNAGEYTKRLRESARDLDEEAAYIDMLERSRQ